MPQKETLAEQKATIVNAELSGLSSDDLSQVAELLNACMDAVESIVAYQGGKIVHFIGTNFLAIFAGKKSEKENANVALNALLEIQTKFNNFSEDKKTENPIGLSAGIATGEVIWGEAGLDNKRITLLGEALEQAIKIKQIANQGQVLTEKNTFSLCKGKFNFNQLEPIPVKGMEEPLQLFKLINKKEAKLTFNSEPGRLIQSNMVGREKEKELLLTAVTSLTKGEGGIVNIIGPAGTGKSRLVAEIKKETIVEKTGWFEGRGLSNGQNQSYHPIIRIFKSWAEIGENDLPDLSAQKLHTAIQQLGQEEANEIFPFMATMMGLPLTGKFKERVEGIEGEALEKLILKNLRDLIILASKRRPLAFMIEDMHWADSSSIAFFESLFKLAANHRVLFINVFRPGYEHTGDYIIKYLTDNFPHQHTTITINPLAESESGKLITNLMNETQLPAEISQVIIHKTKGNPFFIEEVIRSFLDEGIIEIKDKKFHLTEKIHKANIPGTINEVILSRVDNLDEKTKELLKTASVIGRNFYYKVLEEAADTIGELDERLEYLKEVQLIGEGNQKEEIEYLFKHALAQQATYESIVLNSKKELHLKIACSIEKVFADNIHEFYGTLAYHFEQANNMEKAEEYLIKAGDEALKSGAPHEAKYNWEKGFDIYQKLNKGNLSQEILASYYYKLSLACHSRGLNLEAIDYIEKYQGIYLNPPPANNIRLIFGIIRRVGNLILALNFSRFYFKKEPTIIDDSLIKLSISKGEAMITVNPKKFFIDLIYFTNRIINWNLLKTQYGVEFFIASSTNFIWTGISHSLGKKIISVAEKNITQENKAAWMKLRYNKLIYRLWVGDFSTDPDEDRVYEIGLSSGSFFDTTAYLMFSSYLHIEQGNKSRINQILNRFIETSETLENIHARVQYYRMASIASWKFRKIDELFELASKGMEMIEKTGHFAILMLVQCTKANAHSVCNEIEEAKELLMKAEKIATGKKRGVIFYSTYLLAKCHLEKVQIEQLKKTKKLQRKDCKSFRKTSHEAVKYSKMYAGNLIEAYRLRAISLYFSGKYTKALKYFKKSIAFGETSGGKLELSRSFFELGKFLSDPKTKKKKLNGLAGNEYLEKARQLFIEMDLKYDLAELENFMNK